MQFSAYSRHSENTTQKRKMHRRMEGKRGDSHTSDGLYRPLGYSRRGRQHLSLSCGILQWGVLSLETTRGRQHSTRPQGSGRREFHSSIIWFSPPLRIWDPNPLVVIGFHSHFKSLGVAPGQCYLQRPNTPNIGRTATLV